MDTFVSTTAPNRTPPISFSVIYLLSVVFSFHTLVTAYSSSTYLEQFVGKSGVGMLYAIASGLSILLFLYISPFLRRLGNTTLSLLFMSTAVVALILLGLGIYPAVAFIVFITLNPLLYLSLDIYSENTIGENEGQTGTKRGLTLSLMAIASVCAPLAAGALTTQFGNNLALPYFLAAFIGIFFMAIILLAFRRFKDHYYPVLSPLSVICSFGTHRNTRTVISAHFLLQFFFSWIVIYFPLYLATELNIPWSTMGIIIAAGLLAYVLCEYPIGILADRYWGEKEMMAVGFVILALSSASIGFMAAVGTVGWMVVMFMSRVGASLVEVTTESYFFKQVKSGDAPLISLFRITRPLANLIGAVAGSITLLFFQFPLMFILLGILMIPGIILAAYIVDTK